jgi:8-oxo-dGTP pyrophosphatase MutT (NUDIX family)
MTEPILAAGAVVWRPALSCGREAGQPDRVEVLLVHRPRYDDWSLPKGKQDPGEHTLLTAVREVLEETGVRPVLGPRLPTVEYLSRGGPKRVDYWSALGRGGEAGGPASAHEVDAVSWLPLPKAAEQASYSRDAELIRGLRPRETTPLILVRHASAGHKGDWPGEDDQRPLDAKGAADAAVLARLLACFAPRARVISSPTLRCLQTMRPFAEESGGSVEAEAVLAPPGSVPSSSGTNGGAPLRQLIGELVAAGQPAVVCLHRENLPKALAAACAALGAPAAVPGDPALPKGGFWVVHTAAAGLAAVERYEPLGLLVGSAAASAVAGLRLRRRSTRRTT